MTFRDTNTGMGKGPAYIIVGRVGGGGETEKEKKGKRERVQRKGKS